MKTSLLGVLTVLAVALPINTGRAAVVQEDVGFGKVTKPLVEERIPLQTKDGFSAEFWFVDDEHTMPKWLSGDIRDIKQVSVTKRHRLVRVVVFLLNPGQSAFRTSSCDEELQSDVTYDVLVRRPDGFRYVGARGVKAWTGTAPPAHIVQSAKTAVRISFEAIEPLGEYTIMVVVHDNVRKVDIPLIHTLKVRE